MAGLLGLATIQKIRAAINSAFAYAVSHGNTLTLTRGDGTTVDVTLDAASRVGTTTVGSGANPIFLNSGTPVASNSNVGSLSKPLYMGGGTLQPCGNTLDVNISGTANRATYDANGNNIASTYAKKSEVSSGGVSGTGSNFVQLDSGLMICWGSGQAKSNANVSFPASFIDDHVVVSLVSSYGADTLSVSKVGFGYRANSTDIGGEGTYEVFGIYSYTAIGRWK